jgi:hypothetical protein
MSRYCCHRLQQHLRHELDASQNQPQCVSERAEMKRERTQATEAVRHHGNFVTESRERTACEIRSYCASKELCVC